MLVFRWQLKYLIPRWMRDPVWASAKAQDFDALLVMAAEARKKCEEANAQRAPVKASKKKRSKPSSSPMVSNVRVFDLESSMVSQPAYQAVSIDD